MSQTRFQTVINRPIETVFALIIDLKHYGQWLSPSATFDGITSTSDDPIKLGTAYTDKGKTTTLQGRVTKFSPPTRITFQESNHFKVLGMPVGLDIQIQYTLESISSGTQLTREYTLSVEGLLKLVRPVVAQTITTENRRILAVMKAYLESH